MSTNTVIMVRAADLRRGDKIDFEGDQYVDVPDHCMLCNKPVQWFPEDNWTHTDDPEADADHVVMECPRDMSLDSEYTIVDHVFTPESFDAASDAGIHDFGSNMRPYPHTIAIWTTEDQWIVLPDDHEVKVGQRGYCPDCGMDEHPEDAELEAESRVLASRGLNPNDGGESPSWGELADAQGRVDELVAEHGCIVKAIDFLEGEA